MILTVIVVSPIRVKTFEADTLANLETQINTFKNNPINQFGSIVECNYGSTEPGNPDYTAVILYTATAPV